MKITQIINEDAVIAREDLAGEAAYWLTRANNRESDMLFAVVENAFGTIERRFGIGSANVSVLTYRRFAEHMRTSVRRATEEGVRASATDGTLGSLLRQHMPDCYECACEIRSDLERRFGNAVPEDELLDLMLHVHKVVSNAAPARKRA
ncbi:PRD domain-containing protein [Saccharibacillus sp. O23]|uniref:PRD domain-containing protein n=1 Tax=Saccharibacillus sp. O23 TaxID=2009338 RepID=UPI0015C67EE7|nr:PRD domain-containing protein [Saccharibacillus sp. O23]